MARKLRIGVSVFFGVVTIALLAMWVRSYWWRDHFVSHGTLWNRWGFAVHSFRGSTTGILAHPDAISIVEASRNVAIRHDANLFVRPDRGGGFAFESNPVLKKVRVPYWGLVIVSAWIALVTIEPPQSRRFSLRKLLVATTLVAVALGSIVWLTS